MYWNLLTHPHISAHNSAHNFVNIHSRIIWCISFEVRAHIFSSMGITHSITLKMLRNLVAGMWQVATIVFTWLIVSRDFPSLQIDSISQSFFPLLLSSPPNRQYLSSVFLSRSWIAPTINSLIQVSFLNSPVSPLSLVDTVWQNGTVFLITSSFPQDLPFQIVSPPLLCFSTSNCPNGWHPHHTDEHSERLIFFFLFSSPPKLSSFSSNLFCPNLELPQPLIPSPLHFYTNFKLTSSSYNRAPWRPPLPPPLRNKLNILANRIAPPLPPPPSGSWGAAWCGPSANASLRPSWPFTRVPTATAISLRNTATWLQIMMIPFPNKFQTRLMCPPFSKRGFLFFKTLKGPARTQSISHLSLGDFFNMVVLSISSKTSFVGRLGVLD